MDGENDTIEVVIEAADDTAGQVDQQHEQTRKAPERDEATGRFKAVEPADDLKAQFEEQRQKLERDRDAAVSRATTAEREAQRAREEADNYRGAALDSEVQTVESGLATAQAEASAAEQEYKIAFQSGDADAAAAAQRKIARAEARIERLTEAKDDLKVRKAQPAERTREAEPQRRQEAADDGFEKYLSQFSAPTASWMRGHKDWVTNARKNAKLNAAHFDAVEAGHEADTPEYFEFVETAIGLRKAADAEPKLNGNGAHTQNGTRQRKPAVTVAPVNGGGGSVNGGNGNGVSVTLTKGEAERANDGTIVWNYDDPSGKGRFKKGDPIGNVEMARRKMAMKAQGAYDRAYVEQ